MQKFKLQNRSLQIREIQGLHLAATYIALARYFQGSNK